MTREEAIEAIKCNWPDSRYTILREALDMAISALRQQDVTDKDVGKMTNAQKIRSMSDEELAECLFQIGYDNGWSRKEYAIEWLQQPAGEEDKHDTV